MTTNENDYLYVLLIQKQVEILERRNFIATRVLDKALGFELPHNKVVSLLPVVEKEEYQKLKDEYDALEKVLKTVFGKNRHTTPGKICRLIA